MKLLKFWKFLTLAIMVTVANGQSKKNASDDDGEAPVAKTLETRFFKGYRIVNWCITGKDEPQLHEWPFSQFVPLLKRNRRYKQVDPDNNRYRLEIKEVYSRMPWVGATANCHGEDSQSTPAPSFYPTPPPPQQLRGPWCEPLQECLDETTNRTGMNSTTFLCDFTWKEYSSTPGSTIAPLSLSVTVAPVGLPPTTTPTTTPPPIVRWDLTDALPRSPDCTFADVTGCRPELKNSSVLKTLGRLFKTVHITVYAEGRRRLSHGIYEKWEPQKLEGLLLQANHNPFGVGLPTGQFFNGEFHCLDCKGDHFSEIIPCRKRPSVEVAHPTILAFHHMMRVPKLPKVSSPGTVSGFQFQLQPVGKMSEVHSNFRWFSPPCTQTTRLEFTLMVVRSFQNSDFDVIQIGPYQVITRGHVYISDIIPTPIYPAFFYDKNLQGTWCHAADSPDIQTVHPKVLSNFEMSHTFDECVRDELNPLKKELGDLTIQGHTYMCDAPSHAKCFPVAGQFGERRLFEAEQTFGGSENIKCPIVCPDGPTTLPPPPEKKKNSIFKRNHHGGMLIMTNFCLMPVCSFIGRFYKETFNISRIKGVKAWFWAHLIGSGISTVLIYFATFHAGKDLNRTAHVYMGKVYIFLIAATWFSAWGRHKTTWINRSAEFAHGVLGYVTLVLAHITMHMAPDVGMAPKILVDTQIGIHMLFIIILSVHVCKLDNKFGMKPVRRHFPTVEARFDDIPLPQYKFRVITLIVLTAITFVLSFISLFVE